MSHQIASEHLLAGIEQLVSVYNDLQTETARKLVLGTVSFLAQELSDLADELEAKHD